MRAFSSTRSTTTRSSLRFRAAAALPQPNLAGREAAAKHDVKRQAERVEEILLRAAEIREPDLHERANRVLEPRLAGDGECLLVGLAHLVGRDALL